MVERVGFGCYADRGGLLVGWRRGGDDKLRNHGFKQRRKADTGENEGGCSLFFLISRFHLQAFCRIYHHGHYSS